MKIRIVKASSPTFWYANSIGEVFDVKETLQEINKHVLTYRFADGQYGAVSFEDCEEVIEHNSQLYRKVDRPVREGDTVLITKFEGEVVNVVRTVESVVSAYPGDFHFTPLYDGEYYFDGETEECEVLELIEETTKPVQPSAPSYAEVSELLHEANEMTETIREWNALYQYNGKQYRKVKRKASVGDLVVSNVQVDGRVYRVYHVYENGVLGKYSRGHTSIGTNDYFVLEPIEQSGQTELDQDSVLGVIVNLAQEVAELKRQLTDAKTDIADLEDRVDENEKDVEEVIELAVDNQTELLELDATVDEITARINDLGDGVEAADLSGILTELTRLEVQARECSEDYGKEGSEASEQYFDGVADGYKLSIIKLKEALRNG